MKRIYLLATAFLCFGCSRDWHKIAAIPPDQENQGADWYGDYSDKVIRLDQGWSAQQSDWFYKTSQGSRLLPYAFFLALEQAKNTQLFRERRNIQKFRYLPARDGLPLGFVVDVGSEPIKGLISDRRWLGLTCAACHTTQINFRGTAMRIDGGPALADAQGFIAALTVSLEETLRDPKKFDRFSVRVLGSAADSEAKAGLRVALQETARERRAYEKLNHSDVAYGFARLDAFGRIFNKALTLVDPHSAGGTPNAPVNYPHIWDAPHADVVQWTGNARNAGLGSLGRNVGEVVGVFASIDTTTRRPPLGYDSSVQIPNLLMIEERLKGLQSPQWPQSVLGRIDQTMVVKGRALFKQLCSECHTNIVRDNPFRSFRSKLIPIDGINGVNTDPLSAENIRTAQGRTGILKGAQEFVVFGPVYRSEKEPAIKLTLDAVLRVIFGKVTYRPVDPASRRVFLFGKGIDEAIDVSKFAFRADVPPARQYRARPLNGIWATAPYLHNGSVPNLYELLLPAKQRSKKFFVGRREFDPVNVGFVKSQIDGAFPFDATTKGNSNAGHEYGTGISNTERMQLLEYLKSI